MLIKIEVAVSCDISELGQFSIWRSMPPGAIHRTTLAVCDDVLLCLPSGDLSVFIMKYWL